MIPSSYEFFGYVLALYFFVANGFFLFLLGASFWSIRKVIWVRPMVDSLKGRLRLFAPPVSIIAPAYNEEETIKTSIESFERLNYPNYEIIVVNDGSTDKTLSILREEFDLVAVDRFYDSQLSSSQIKSIYRSRKNKRLFVVDKENSGKADSINVGVGYSRYDYFCSVDSDSILSEDCLFRVLMPFIENPEETLAVGGTIRPVNGSRILKGRLVEHRFPTNILAFVQIVEYLRAFLFGRVGWNAVNATMIISGAFGVFRRDSVIRAGGVAEDTVGEDMELIARLREDARQHDEVGRIEFVPDPICWTEVPGDLVSLAKQRERWQRGLAESLYRHRQMFLNPKHGSVGMIAYPYFFLVELCGPVMEFLAYSFIGFGFAMGWIDWSLFALILTADIGFGILMSIIAILIEESAYHKYPKLSQLLMLVFFSFVEHLGYRQCVSFFRLVGLIRFSFGARSWGKALRMGFRGS